MKELYIAPEVEILCFAPVEALASEDWNWSPWGARSSDTENFESIIIPEAPPADGEE